MGIATWLGNGLAVLAALVVVLLAAGWAYETLSEQHDARAFSAPGRLIDIGGGRRLHLYCSGDGPGPIVILEAGGGGTSLSLRPVQDRLAPHMRVCAYDRAGFGWSDPQPAEARGFDARVADLHALLTNAHIPGPYILAGESLGGLIVRLYARDYPRDVAGIVLIDAAEEGVTFAPSFDALLTSMREQSQRFARYAHVAAPRVVAQLAPQSIGLDVVPQHLRGATVAVNVRPDRLANLGREAEAYEQTPAGMRMPGGFGALGATPLIVIRHGRPFTDAMAFLEPEWEAAQLRLAALSANSRVIVARDNGHGIARENPRLVADAIRSLVAH